MVLIDGSSSDVFSRAEGKESLFLMGLGLREQEVEPEVLQIIATFSSPTWPGYSNHCNA